MLETRAKGATVKIRLAELAFKVQLLPEISYGTKKKKKKLHFFLRFSQPETLSSKLFFFFFHNDFQVILSAELGLQHCYSIHLRFRDSF